MGANFSNFDSFSTDCPLGTTHDHIDASWIFSNNAVPDTMSRSQYPIIGDDTSTTELGAMWLQDIGPDHGYLPRVVLKRDFTAAYDASHWGINVQLSERSEGFWCRCPERFE